MRILIDKALNHFVMLQESLTLCFRCGKKRSQGARSGMYGGWGNVSIPRTSRFNLVWAAV